MTEFASDIIVIGAGMAGSSIAAHLSRHATVQLLEMESQPGYHSTGRSAAVFTEAYGNEVIRALTRASRAFFFSPPAGFCETQLVRPRTVLVTARDDQGEMLKRFMSGLEPCIDATEIGVDAAVALCPVLRREGLVSALLDRSPADIEVHELQQGYLRLLKARGGRIATHAQVIGLAGGGQDWRVETPGGVYRAPRVINAAGAWAEQIGAMAGAQALGMTPRRRTALLIDAPQGLATQGWPMLLDVEEKFYLKPDAGLLLLSPADETPTEPGDAQPDEMDIAIAVDRLQTATTLQVSHVRRKWAGLRSFVADRSPVVGYDTLQPGFFWLAALGGYGIQTAPALSEFAAQLVLGLPLGDRVAQFGVEIAAMSPGRLTRRPVLALDAAKPTA